MSLPAGHQPIIPPFSPQTRQQLANTLADLRRAQVDLQYAQTAGLNVAADLDAVQATIGRLQRLWDHYFAGIIQP